MIDFTATKPLYCSRQQSDWESGLNGKKLAPCFTQSPSWSFNRMILQATASRNTSAERLTAAVSLKPHGVCRAPKLDFFAAVTRKDFQRTQGHKDHEFFKENIMSTLRIRSRFHYVSVVMKHSEILYPNEELSENRCWDYHAQLSIKLVEFGF